MKRLVAFLPALVLATTAMAQDVNYNYAKDANFSAFKTYAWSPINAGGQQLDQLTADQLRSAIDSELATKGLRKVEGGQADLIIGLQVAINQEQQLTAQTYGGGWRFGGGFATAETSTILVGSFALNMTDRAQNKLVWRGIATKTIDTNAKPDKRQKNITKGVQKVLKNYPPK